MEERLTPTQREAADLVAQAELTHGEIARHVGVSARTLTTWKNLPAFDARVQEIRREAAERSKESTIATVAGRTAERESRWQDLRQVRLERKKRAVASGDAEKFPGARSGLYAPVIQSDAGGTLRVVDYRLDKDLADGMLKIEEATAADLGQRINRKELSGPNGGPIAVEKAYPPHEPEWKIQVAKWNAISLAVDVLRLADAIREAGRWPTTHEEADAILEEVADRREAERRWLKVPGWEVPFSLTEALAAAERAAQEEDDE